MKNNTVYVTETAIAFPVPPSSGIPNFPKMKLYAKNTFTGTDTIIIIIDNLVNPKLSINERKTTYKKIDSTPKLS